VPEYLGRVSYSLYLMHSIVLFAVLDLLYGRLPKLALFGMVMVGSLVLGHLFCVAVEEPAMRLGKRLAKRLAGRGPVRALGKRPASAVAFP
jgi:peptidoglycan/LPS O-acetylase OafA/YrhL